MTDQDLDNILPSAMPRGRRGVTLALLCFALTTLSMATVGLLVPILPAFANALRTSPAEIGMALSLFSLPSAFCSILSGQLCDRYGSRSIFLGGATVAVLADVLIYCSGSLPLFGSALLLAGAGFSCIVVSAPALLITQLEGAMRAKALSLWVTYAPVGVACGLLLAAPFAGTASWRGVLLLHTGLLAAATAAGGYVLRQNGIPAVARSVPSIREVGRLLCEGTIVRLGLALAIPSAISYGTSLLAPSYIAQVHHVGLGSASTFVAVAKIAVVVSGGLFTGWVLSRNAHAGRTFNFLWAGGLVGQSLLFFPESGFVVGVAGFGLWLFAYAGIAAVAMTLLPQQFPDPKTLGLANGIISQLISCASFLAPIVYFADLPWWSFPMICAGSLLASTMALPRKIAATG